MSIRVLVVDDSKLARIVLTRTIKALQPEWVCIEASSAEDAFFLFDSQHADIAILDYNMPGTNGLELAQHLRARSTTMPLAIVTANIQTEILAGARALSAHFVPKPVTEEALHDFLAEAQRRLLYRADPSVTGH